MHKTRDHKSELRLSAAWRRIERPAFTCGVMLATAGVLHTLWGFKHLLFGGSHFDFSGGDLLYRRAEISAWFAGLPVYGAIPSAVYPPASFPMLWPLIGWLDPTPMLRLWACLYAIGLSWLVLLVLRAAPGETGLRRLWLALLPLSMFATGRAVEVGQQIPVLLPPLLTGLILVSRQHTSWAKDLLGSLLIVFGLTKPTAAIPLALIAFLVPGRIRPAMLITSVYAGLTLFAAAFQPANVIQLLRAWLGQESLVPLGRTNVNLHKLLDSLGYNEWLLPAAALILVVTAYWLWADRGADLWLLLGVTALVARLWMYHLPPDDLLILPALIALFRVATRTATPGARLPAATLLTITWLWSLTSRLQLLGPYAPWRLWYDRIQALIWLSVLTFLIIETWQTRRGHPAAVTPAPEFATA